MGHARCSAVRTAGCGKCPAAGRPPEERLARESRCRRSPQVQIVSQRLPLIDLLSGAGSRPPSRRRRRAIARERRHHRARRRDAVDAVVVLHVRELGVAVAFHDEDRFASGSVSIANISACTFGFCCSRACPARRRERASCAPVHGILRSACASRRAAHRNTGGAQPRRAALRVVWCRAPRNSVYSTMRAPLGSTTCRCLGGESFRPLA